jgi:hypothetical protein
VQRNGERTKTGKRREQTNGNSSRGAVIDAMKYLNDLILFSFCLQSSDPAQLRRTAEETKAFYKQYKKKKRRERLERIRHYCLVVFARHSQQRDNTGGHPRKH